MQSTNGHEVPSVDSRFTLILLACEQGEFLRRALAWYGDFPMVVKVLDSSASADAYASGLVGVDYLHVPELAGAELSERLLHALEGVDSPYVVWASVESFLLPDALEQAVEFLEAHPGHVGAQGYSLGYEAGVDRIDYLLRDLKVDDGHDQGERHERIERFMSRPVSLQHAVLRTVSLRPFLQALPRGTSVALQEAGLAAYLLNVGQVRVLDVPYVLHLADAQAQARHTAALQGAMQHGDPKTRSERQAFVAALAASLPVEESRLLEAFALLADGLKKRPYQGRDKLFCCIWNLAEEVGEAHFEPRQHVELPFYNRAFFDVLARVEFLIHVFPAGRQLAALEGVLLRQAELAGRQSNPDAEPLLNRLWRAYALYAFSEGIVRRLEQELRSSKQGDEKDRLEQIEQLTAWGQRLRATSPRDNASLLDEMPSGRLLQWLASRTPEAAELKRLLVRQAANPAGAQIGVLLLDLEADIFKLQASFDSLINSHYRNFKVIVFTTGELPAATTLQHKLHFVKVTASNYIDRINQVIRQSDVDWLMLAQAGEQFTPAGLLLASDALMDAADCRAVAVDSIHRQADDTLQPVLLPDFNLDLLQSLPSLMARHWLVRRSALVEAGGYSRDYPDALEFDLLLRLIEQGGMGGMAHLSEPVVICQAPSPEANEDQQKALTRHLATRGYQAEVGSASPGTFKIDYRHEHRPMVSVLISCQDNLADLQRCLVNLLQRSRYPRYEVLIGDAGSQSPELFAWLQQQEKLSNRIRVFRADEPMSSAAMHNQLSQQAKGEYLVLLDARSQVINVGWIESMLNQAQRPEVGVVGVKLVDQQGSVTQAGLILGFDDAVGSAFVGATKQDVGYMQRLAVEQNVSAVSGACLMIDKALFEALGGLDEQVFAAAYADVDLCLSASAAGYLTVWTPQVQVVHPGDIAKAPEALHALRSKWAAAFEHDTAYNRHLALRGQGYTLDI